MHFQQGSCVQLPFEDASFDVVFSSLLFHHLTREQKLQTFAEIVRVLRPGGALYVADWGKARNPCSRCLFLFVQCLDGVKTTADNVNGLLPELLTQGGFKHVEELDRFMTVVGELYLYRADKEHGDVPSERERDPDRAANG